MAAPEPPPTLWALLGVGKQKMPIIIDGEFNDEDGQSTISFKSTEGDRSMNLDQKDVLWMYAACTCFCCGLRERQLLCQKDDHEAGMEHFGRLHGSLKSVEAGNDVRGISRIELMYHDGEVLSIGMRCECQEDTAYFNIVKNCFKQQAGLMVCTASTCKLRRRLEKQSTQVVNGYAEAEALRHMEELIALEDLHVAKGQSRRKRKQRGKTSTESQQVSSLQRSTDEDQQLQSLGYLVQETSHEIAVGPEGEDIPEDASSSSPALSESLNVCELNVKLDSFCLDEVWTSETEVTASMEQKATHIHNIQMNVQANRTVPPQDASQVLVRLEEALEFMPEPVRGECVTDSHTVNLMLEGSLATTQPDPTVGLVDSSIDQGPDKMRNLQVQSGTLALSSMFGRCLCGSESCHSSGDKIVIDNILPSSPPGLPQPSPTSGTEIAVQSEAGMLVALQKDLDEVKAMLDVSLVVQAEQSKLISSLMEQQSMFQSMCFQSLLRSNREAADTCLVQKEAGAFAWEGESPIEDVSWFSNTGFGMKPKLSWPIQHVTEPMKVYFRNQVSQYPGSVSIPCDATEPMFIPQYCQGVEASIGDCIRDDISTSSTTCCTSGQCGTYAKDVCELCTAFSEDRGYTSYPMFSHR